MKSNVYGLIGIVAPYKSWNVHNDGTKRDAIFGSSKTLKYALKNFWKMSGQRVMFISSGKSDVEQLPMEERYEDIFGEKFDENYKKSVKNLMGIIDCKHFGFTYKRGDRKVEQEGAVIIGPGRNIVVPGLAAGEEPKPSDMVRYAHSYTINPILLANSCEDVEYTDEDFEAFKAAAAGGADLLDTMQERGCKNEYLLIVQTSPATFLKSLDKYVTIEGNEIKLGKLAEYLLGFGKKVESVDLYYDTETMTAEDNEKANGFIKLHPLNTI